MADMSEENGVVTIAKIAALAGVSSATVSYVLNHRTDVKVSEATRRKILAICEEMHYEKGAGRGRPQRQKQVTIDDIAREAGVSTATVSYVINDRKDIKISEETRRKVLQICNLRQYAPSFIARSLAARKNDQVGLCFPVGASRFRDTEYLALIRSLQSELQACGYATLLLPPAQIAEARTQNNIDGIICADLTESEFYHLKESYFVPIVAVDMIVSDPLFFKAYTDYTAVAAAARRMLGTDRLVCIARPPRNEPYRSALKEAFGNDELYFADDVASLRRFALSRRGSPVLFADGLSASICSDVIDRDKTAVICENDPPDPDISGPAVLRLPLQDKAARAVAMLQSAIRREESQPHTFALSPDLTRER